MTSARAGGRPADGDLSPRVRFVSQTSMPHPGGRAMESPVSEPCRSSPAAAGRPGRGPSARLLRRPVHRPGARPGPRARGSSAHGVRAGAACRIRLIVAVVSAILLVGTATHILPAIRAGLHDGTRGSWVATDEACPRSACIWNGKFVSPGGHVLLTLAQYSGRYPRGFTRAPACRRCSPAAPGSCSRLTGSDLWIELLIACWYRCSACTGPATWLVQTTSRTAEYGPDTSAS